MRMRTFRRASTTPPAEWPADADGTTYLDFFQRDRLKQQKGIIAIDLTGLP
jgi:hypothetical protein